MATQTKALTPSILTETEIVVAGTQSRVDIIIVNYKSTPLLLRCLKSIERYLNALEPNIYIEDNSVDNSADEILNCFPRVRLRKNRRNIGFGAAVNQALIEGDSPFVMLLNPDSEVLADFLSPLLDYLRNNPRIGILGPRVYDRDGRRVQESARSFPNATTVLFGRTSLLSHCLPNNRFSKANLLATDQPANMPAWVDWVSGACMIVRRDAYLQVGGMDERFFMYWEDADWCRRMWRSDWAVVYFPIPAVKHLVGASSNQLKLRSTFEFHRSVFYLFKKYNPWASFWAPMVLTALLGRFVLTVTTKTLRRMRTQKGNHDASF